MALEEHSILIKALATAELWPLFSGRSPEALPTGEARGRARHPSFGVIVKDQKPWKMEICADLLMENHVFTEAVLKWPPLLLLE